MKTFQLIHLLLQEYLCADSYDETKWYRVEDEIVSDPLTQHTKLYR